MAPSAPDEVVVAHAVRQRHVHGAPLLASREVGSRVEADSRRCWLVLQADRRAVALLALHSLINIGGLSQSSSMYWHDLPWPFLLPEFVPVWPRNSAIDFASAAQHGRTHVTPDVHLGPGQARDQHRRAG